MEGWAAGIWVMSDAESKTAIITRLVRNEQAKLAATFFNNIAVAFIVAGVIVPIVASAYGTAVPTGRFWIAYILLWLVMAYTNHLIGRTILKGIKP